MKLKTLLDAYQCCSDCGTEFGTPRAGSSSWWMDICDVCGEEKAVTETRDFGYLHRGVLQLKKNLSSENS